MSRFLKAYGFFKLSLLFIWPLYASDPLSDEFRSFRNYIVKKLGTPIKEFGKDLGYLGYHNLVFDQGQAALMVTLEASAPFDNLYNGGSLGPFRDSKGVQMVIDGLPVWEMKLNLRWGGSARYYHLFAGLGISPTMSMKEFMGIFKHELVHMRQSLGPLGTYSSNLGRPSKMGRWIMTDRMRGQKLIRELEAHAAHSPNQDTRRFRAIWEDIQNEMRSEQPNARKLNRLLGRGQSLLPHYEVLQGAGARKSAIRWLKALR